MTTEVPYDSGKSSHGCKDYVDTKAICGLDMYDFQISIKNTSNQSI